MATWDDVRRIALALPRTDEARSGYGYNTWRVQEKGFVWERPLGKSDVKALGDAAPDGPILAARVPDVGAKDALLADNPAAFFTTPHFDGYPVILIRLDVIGADELREVVVEAWLNRAPKRLAKQYLENNP